MAFSRYAIYVLPDAEPLARFGASWLGWDARTGKHMTAPHVPSLPLPWEEITQAPRKYGFHGTVKAPFRLADGYSEEGLRETFTTFCARTAPVDLDGLELAQLGRFLALVPIGDTCRLSQLAAVCVQAFDPFRAPLSPAELEKRRRPGLNDNQDALLRTWGYPYVMEEFRFHLTLTRKLPKARATELRGILDPLLAPLLPAPFSINALSLVGEGDDGYFRQIQSCNLTGPA